jgi:hypothetical protein
MLGAKPSAIRFLVTLFPTLIYSLDLVHNSALEPSDFYGAAKSLNWIEV